MHLGIKGKNIVVIGATGFIGSHLAPALALHGSNVVCVSRNIRNRQFLTSKNMIWDECDASNRADIKRIINRYNPKIIYHLTSDSKGGRAITLIPDSIQNDLMATINILLESAQAGGIHVVMTGSVEEPGKDDKYPCSPYAAAKAASTAYARMISSISGLEVSILRLMMVYGPNQKNYKVLPYVINQLRDGQLAELGSGARALDWVYVDDVIDAFLRAGSLPWTSADPIDIGTGSLMRLRDCLEMIGELMGRADLLRFGAIDNRAQEREDSADTELARLRLGWKAKTNFRDGIQATINSIIK
ncbi:NAD(P)-dependent oxidoreductase [Bosea sp. BK604]|uniref:NAD-dependent epimerase/dehydratase family protein n=1 Tax=Bosea sp. BK604 TaxID=2512180 RepID=UPI00104D3DC3|nr:NAD(P)-dependent oxidoreductase [Bosea sp. BK604]TCR61506.1 nucleoside-diphosphate-sugar epimerase [Bosea sp. BK604]